MWIEITFCDKVYPVLYKNLFVGLRPLPPKEPDISYAFVVEDCGHKGDSIPVAMKDLVLVNDYGLVIYWNRDRMKSESSANDFTVNNTYVGTDDIQGIFDCTITIKLGPHDPRIAYQEMILGMINRLDFSLSPFLKEMKQLIAELDPENLIANRGLKELQKACFGAEIDCKDFGCIVIEYGDKVWATCKTTIKNIGDKFNWFTRDDIRIRVLAVGAFIGKNKDNISVPIPYPPINQKLRLDITRLYGGPCYNKQQFYCPTHGICIKYSLACDGIGMWNCPYFDSPINGKSYDERDACPSYVDSIPPNLNLPDPNATTNLYIFWILIGIFLALLGYLLLNYCFWRPGYMVWRCGRIRNWFHFGNCCFKSCHDCSKSCNTPCCKTNGTYDTTEISAVNWSKFPTGDGFHMRENR